MLKQKVMSLPTVISHNIFIANVAIFTLLVVFISVYLAQINSTTQLGLEVGSLEDNLIASQEFSKDLQLEVAEYQSIVNLQERIKDTDMELAKISQVNYVSVAVPASSVAKR